MPSLTLSGQEISDKRLLRSMGRSAKVFQWHKSTFHFETLPRLRKLALSFWRAAQQSEDLAAKLALSKEYRELSEMRRQLLGFPSPGRRRDESEREKSANASPGIVEIVSANETS